MRICKERISLERAGGYLEQEVWRNPSEMETDSRNLWREGILGTPQKRGLELENPALHLVLWPLCRCARGTCTGDRTACSQVSGAFQFVWRLWPQMPAKSQVLEGKRHRGVRVKSTRHRSMGGGPVSMGGSTLWCSAGWEGQAVKGVLIPPCLHLTLCLSLSCLSFSSPLSSFKAIKCWKDISQGACEWLSH